MPTSNERKMLSSNEALKELKDEGKPGVSEIRIDHAAGEVRPR